MAAHYGALQEFRPEVEELSREWNCFSSPTRRLPRNRYLAILFNVMGATTYGVLRSLLAPTNPKEKSMAEVVAA